MTPPAWAICLPPSFLASRFRLLACSLALLLFAGGAFGATVTFNIPAQPAPAALQAFMKQSGLQVMFLPDELKIVQANEVKGAMEPAEALGHLLDGTGFVAKSTASGNFVVGKVEKATAGPGSIKGSLTSEGGAPAAGVRVIIRETGQAAETDRNGEFLFSAVEPGNYIVVARAEGYQLMHIEGVHVQANRELTLGAEAMRRSDGVTRLEPFVVQAETVTELEKVEVSDTKPKSFSDANVDIPRGINDVQPYYVFDAKTIDQSGATNVEEFLKNRLTMDTTALSNAQFEPGNGSPRGTSSTINLRGLGANETLILVDGRRMAGVNLGDNNQPDLNGIPLGAIDRIEVLPSSASGIYGGSAIGGVVNIILKKDYTGGEIRATYENTTDSDAPIRTASIVWGGTMDHGKTHLMLSAQYSDAKVLLFQDRRQLFDRGFALISRNEPTAFYGPYDPFVGATPNIYSDSGDNLLLKSGAPLNSPQTSIPAGTSSSTPAATLEAGLLGNAGRYNFDLPESNQSPTGLLRPLGSAPRTNSEMATLSHRFSPVVEVFGDFSHQENHARSFNNPFGGLFVPESTPTNPFASDVDMTFPVYVPTPFNTDMTMTSFTVGATITLPHDWTAELDYTWSNTKFSYLYDSYDYGAFTSDIASGALNPFVDILAYPPSLQKYLATYSDHLADSLDDFAVRAAGPLPRLPWGVPTLVAGLEQRTDSSPQTTYSHTLPVSTAQDSIQITFPQKQVTRSVYSELDTPLVKNNFLPLVHALELQLSGRAERYRVTTGTSGAYYSPASDTTTYLGPTTPEGRPYFTHTSYTSTNFTEGLKYQPIPELTFRVSHATAFLPPDPSQLLKNPEPDSNTSTVTDPKSGATYAVQTVSGGNPTLKPQSSASWNAGVIWQPTTGALQGLRANLEWYQITQHNAIGSLRAQDIVTAESTYPGRITRDANGRITLVDVSLLNLFKYDTQGFDASIDYQRTTPFGTFSLHAAATYIVHESQQDTADEPLVDYASYVASGGPDKWKGNATLTWEHGHWTTAWTTRYFGAYQEQGAPGDPDQSTYYLSQQGSARIPSQIYHDIFVSYAFGRAAAEDPSGLGRFGAAFADGLTFQAGVKNVFNTLPPFDAYYSPFYASPFGDYRLRSYWLSVRKVF